MVIIDKSQGNVEPCVRYGVMFDCGCIKKFAAEFYSEEFLKLCNIG